MLKYNSPGYFAHNCTVTVIESVTKVISFFTVTRQKANNRAANAEPIATRRLLQELIFMNIPISYVATDNIFILIYSLKILMRETYLMSNE